MFTSWRHPMEIMSLVKHHALHHAVPLNFQASGPITRDRTIENHCSFGLPVWLPPPSQTPPPYTSPRVKTGSVMDQCRKLQRCFSQLHGRGTHAEELQTQRRTRAIQQPLPLERGQWQQWCIKLHIWAYSIHDNRGNHLPKRSRIVLVDPSVIDRIHNQLSQGLIESALPGWVHEVHQST